MSEPAPCARFVLRAHGAGVGNATSAPVEVLARGEPYALLRANDVNKHYKHCNNSQHNHHTNRRDTGPLRP